MHGEVEFTKTNFEFHGFTNESANTRTNRTWRIEILGSKRMVNFGFTKKKFAFRNFMGLRTNRRIHERIEIDKSKCWVQNGRFILILRKTISAHFHKFLPNFWLILRIAILCFFLVFFKSCFDFKSNQDLVWRWFWRIVIWFDSKIVKCSHPWPPRPVRNALLKKELTQPVTRVTKILSDAAT